MVGDAGVGLPMIYRKGERRTRILPKDIGDEVTEHWISLDQVVRGMEVLKEWEVEGFADFIPDRKEKQSTTILPQLPHRCWRGHRCGEKKVGFTLPLF